MLSTPFFSRPEMVGQAGRNWPEYEPWRVDRINGLYRDFATVHPDRLTLLDLNGFVSPGGQVRGVHRRHAVCATTACTSRLMAPTW